MHADACRRGLSERHAGRIIGQQRGTQRYVPTVPAGEDALTRAIVALASEYGRYGDRRVTALLQAGGWRVGEDRVQRIWRREGLKVPQKHRRRSRLWLNDDSCVRLRPFIRCDNGPEMISKATRKGVAETGSQIQSIAPGSSWENGYCESFNGTLKDECLRQRIFYALMRRRS